MEGHRSLKESVMCPAGYKQEEVIEKWINTQ
jgi:hypothetical protein